MESSAVIPPHHTGNTQTMALLCQFDKCPGHFHRVQMWRSWDPSWFHESIRVHKGRVSVHLLAWRDTDFQQKERLTADPHMHCMWVIFFSFFYIYRSLDLQHGLLFFPHLRPNNPLLCIHTTQWFSLCKNSLRASWVQEHEKDALHRRHQVYSGVLSHW